ncbi:MAG: hypothetical protein PHO67_03990 [Candidatus Omnitrophica bacterium]|nr:hypothetical protein [Candidatus Omnitrophota bacterium]
MNMNTLKDVRDCVMKSLNDGVSDLHEFRIMRYGIICELKRIGCGKDRIEEIMKRWNEKNYKKLSFKDFREQVKVFIDWVFKKDAKVGCNYFTENMCCIAGCRYKENKIKEDNKKLSEEVVYTQSEIEKFLTEYDECKHSRECSIVYKIMDNKRVALGLLRKQILYMSFEEMAKMLWENGYSTAKPMNACRFVRELVDSGLLEIVERGKKGNFHSLANGYNLKTPEDVYNKDLFEYSDGL